MKKILLPIDGSEHSKRALAVAIDLCHKRESDYKITLLHVNGSSGFRGGESPYTYKMAADRTNNENEELLKKFAQPIVSAGIRCDSVVVNGDAATLICKKAKDDQYDMIVMGSRGLNALEELFLGSVSHKVLQHAHCPVTIVK